MVGLGTANMHKHPKMSTERNNKIDSIKSCCRLMPIVLNSFCRLMIMFNSNPSLKNKQERPSVLRGELTRRLAAGLGLALLLLSGCGFLPGSQPPTRTPLPTLTPTPQFQRYSAERIIRAIQAAGLEAAAVRPVAVSSFGAPDTPGAEALAFALPSICPDCSGVALSFARPDDLAAAKSYMVEVQSQQQPAWIFAKDNVLLHLDGALSEAQARQYGQILVALP